MTSKAWRWQSDMGASAWCFCGSLVLLRLLLTWHIFYGGPISSEGIESLTPSSVIVHQPLSTKIQNHRMFIMLLWPALITCQNSEIRGISPLISKLVCKCPWRPHKTQRAYEQKCSEAWEGLHLCMVPFPMLAQGQKKHLCPTALINNSLQVVWQWIHAWIWKTQSSNEQEPYVFLCDKWEGVEGAMTCTKLINTSGTNFLWNPGILPC